MNLDHFSHPAFSRRSFLSRSAAGFGAVALAGMLSSPIARVTAASSDPLAPKKPHFPAKAKRIIFLFMEGGVSQLDTWDHKPTLQEKDGKTGPGGGTLVGSKFKFQKYGETGTWVSELYKKTARHVDKLCFLRGMHTDSPDHPQGLIQLHTGVKTSALTRPSMGAWLTYGLGTENQNVPGYISINAAPDQGGPINYGSAFLPAHYQGTRIGDKGEIANLKPALHAGVQRKQIDFIQQMNRDLAQLPEAPGRLESVIESYELAYRMQDAVPELLDISSEPEHIQKSYGITDGPAGSFARQCLMARRLSESGVRFVEICQRDGGSSWDHHDNLHNGLIDQCQKTDQAIAALLDDLEQRGLLDETLVLYGSEFGRAPTGHRDGRDHNITGFTMWLAGAGVKQGFSYGTTDEVGKHAVEGRMHITDLHATLLALMGLDHEQLTFPYAGREFRLTDVEGNVAREIFA